MNEFVKKLLAYAAIMGFLACAAFFVYEIRVTRALIRNPALSSYFAGTEKNPPPYSVDSADFVLPNPRTSEDDALFTVAELSWILRERIILEVIRAFAGTEALPANYRERVGRYHARVEAGFYRESDMVTAVARVEAKKREIVESAFDEALAVALSADARMDRADAAAICIWTVQKILQIEGLYAGDLTGAVNEETLYAANMYRIRANLETQNTIDGALASYLKECLLLRYLSFPIKF